MSEFLNEMIETVYEFLETANGMIDSCRMKTKKKCSNCRIVIAFYLRRAIEISESFIVLIKASRFADSALLLRSLWEMGINTDYIFSDKKSKEINAIKLQLHERQEQINLLEKNKEEIRKAGLDVDTRLAELARELQEMKVVFSKEHKHTDWKWPKIFVRADRSTKWVIKQAYRQVYAYLCNIDHHDMSFGGRYVDNKKCEPLREPEPDALLRPEVNIFMVRAILIEIMKTFNEEYLLKWEDKLQVLERKQDSDYEEMRKINGIAKVILEST